ncbi:glycosyltransferase family 2 protein [Gaetbulibacter aestuarii]|uniref:Glycosyltransferase n=1 Tax=Gaetbulibacter aestuarii TaxID=1502358 RepID=A0ABW7N2T7_9FLAO
MSIELSVLLITYNNELHIRETLDSLVQQSCDFNFEIAVGDDKSTDKTFEIIRAYATEYPGLFNIQQNRSQLGILGNLKTTLDRCNGRLIFNFDGDDIVKSKEALQKFVDTFKQKPEIGFVDSGYDRLLNEENKIIPFSNRSSIFASKETYKNLIKLGQVIPVGMCFKKDLIYQYVDFDYYMGQNITIEDYPILVDMVMHCDFERIEESLHIYRVHSSSYSHKKSFERIYFLNNQMLKLFNHFHKKYHFSKSLVETYVETHHKSVLFNAGKYENKNAGRESFNSIKNKSIRDYIHYWASQYPIVGRLIRLKKAFYSVLKKSLGSRM